MPISASSGHYTALIPIFAATDPVGGLDHSLPVHPDDGRSKSLEYWEEQLHKRKPNKQKPQAPAEKPHDPSRQIDDFA